jgi:hypothetical protein
MKRTAHIVSACALGLAGVAAVDAATGAEVQARSSCVLFAEKPTLNIPSVAGTGGREGCVSTRTVTVRLREDRRWWPDRTLVEKTATGSNVLLTAAKSCVGEQGKQLYTETRTNTGGKVQSPRVSFAYGCNR